MNWGTIHLEVDEHQHSDRRIRDETARMVNIFLVQTVQGSAEKVHTIRFNPDAFTEDGATQRVPMEQRMARLMEVIATEPVKQHSVSYLVYSRSKDCPFPDVCLHEEYPGSLRALVNM